MTSDNICRHELQSTPHCTSRAGPHCDLLIGTAPRCEVSARVRAAAFCPGGACPDPEPRRGELPLRTMVLPSLLELLNVFLRQSTLTKATASDRRRRPSRCPAALMPRPPGLPLSCRHGWEARERTQRLPAEGREVRQMEKLQSGGQTYRKVLCLFIFSC